MSEYKPGDVVSLKNGNGPHMTVEMLRRDGLICTIWFDVHHQLHRDAFDDFNLRLIQPLEERM
jgi:uncharacterized protein YodC (DUF2158 family)